LLNRYTTWLCAMVLLCAAVVPLDAAAGSSRSPQEMRSEYEGRTVRSIELPGVSEGDTEHLLRLIAQKAGEPLNRDRVRDSIRILYGTGRFADIEAEAVPSGDGVVLTFTTAPNFFVGAVTVEGTPNRSTHKPVVHLAHKLFRIAVPSAPSRPTANQIINASKFQLGELYTTERLDRALENIRHLMQESGYYQALVTAESTSNPATQQVNILVHITANAAARVGTVTLTGTSGLSVGDVEQIAHIYPGDRVTATMVHDALQRLRKKFQKQARALAQVSVTQQTYNQKTNAVDFTFQIDPGPVVVIYATGYGIGRRTMRKEIPVYEEDAVDDDLLNEGRRNLLEYLQTHGHFDATVDIEKKSEPEVLHVIYRINPGPVHTLVRVEIAGNKEFLDTGKLRSYLQIQPAGRFLSHGRYSGELLKSDVATLESLYRSNGFRDVKIDTKVLDDYHAPNRLAVEIHIEEGPRTRVGEVHLTGNEKIPTSELPEMSTQPGQPYSEEDLANDRARILNHYFNNGFPNATLDITTTPSSDAEHREDVTFAIQEGERFRVNRILIDGTEHTREYIVDRQLQMRPEEPLSQQALLDTQTRLYNLGIFSQVDTAVQNPEGADPLKNVLVQLQEANRYTFTYGAGLEFETGLPTGTAPQGTTGISPRVTFNVTRLNVFGRDQTLSFQSHVGRLQQRGLVSYTFPELFNNEKFKLINTVFYDNSLDVSTFTSQRLEGKIDVRQQIGSLGNEPGTRPGPNTITYRFDFRTVKASHFAHDFNPGEIQLFSLPARVGGPGFTFIHDKRDNPLESTKGDYFTLDSFVATDFFGTRSEAFLPPPSEPGTLGSYKTNFGRALGQYSTYYAFGPGHGHQQFVFARSTTIGIAQPFNGTRVLPPGACPLNQAGEPTCTGFATIPLPEQFFAGGGNSHRGFGLNQAGPRDPTSGFPVGGTALFVNSMELRFPETSLPYLGEGFGFAIFHDMGNVFTAPHDMIKGLLRWHQDDPGLCLSGSTPNSQCMTQFNNSGYDYTSHAVGLGLRYRTPIGPLRFDFGYNLNPTRYFESITNPNQGFLGVPAPEAQRLGHFNVFFSIGQPF
jgi:outer membrane protein insertion porin family